MPAAMPAPAIAGYVERLREDIAAMQPDALRSLHMARAADHLHAYMEVTAAALERVRANADALQAAADRLGPEAAAAMAGPLDAIREACLDQEQATERLRKIDSTLDFVGRRLDGLHRLLHDSAPGTGEAEIIEFRGPGESAGGQC